jgi:hypothetical protein
MKKILYGVLAALCVTTLLASPAWAANVTVRVEGDGQTLVPGTVVATSSAPVGKDGKNCPGTSALGALDRATAGDWGGTYFDGFSSWFVETIRGETHASTQQGYWAVYVNYAASNLGICGAELQEGDALLIAPDTAGPVLRLSGLPATVAPGATVTVRVDAYVPPVYPATETTVAPAAGTTISFGGATTTTGADGTAQLTFAGAGVRTVQATKPGHVRSATESVCVTNGNDGSCGTPLPAGAGVGSGSSDDKTAPFASFSRLTFLKVFGRKRAPRKLAGSVTPDPSGLKEVRLSIMRRVGGRCWVFDGTGEHFRRGRCGAWRSFSIGDRAAWSYLLPKRLPRGRYAIRAVAVDNAGNDSVTKVVIYVR